MVTSLLPHASLLRRRITIALLDRRQRRAAGSMGSQRLHRAPHQPSGCRGRRRESTATRAGVRAVANRPAMKAARARPAGRRTIARGEAVKASTPEVDRHGMVRTTFHTTQCLARPPAHHRFLAAGRNRSRASGTGNSRVQHNPRRGSAAPVQLGGGGRRNCGRCLWMNGG